MAVKRKIFKVRNHVLFLVKRDKYCSAVFQLLSAEPVNLERRRYGTASDLHHVAYKHCQTCLHF